MQIDDIIKKEFSKSFMGYDIHEVDLFLDQVIDQIEKYEAERHEMLTAMEFLLKEFEQMEKVSTLTSKPLEMAEKTPIRLQRSNTGLTRVKKAIEGDAAGDATVEEEVETGTAAPDFLEEDFTAIINSVSRFSESGGAADSKKQAEPAERPAPNGRHDDPTVRRHRVKAVFTASEDRGGKPRTEKTPDRKRAEQKERREDAPKTKKDGKA